MRIACTCRASSIRDLSSTMVKGLIFSGDGRKALHDGRIGRDPTTPCEGPPEQRISPLRSGARRRPPSRFSHKGFGFPSRLRGLSRLGDMTVAGPLTVSRRSVIRVTYSP